MTIVVVSGNSVVFVVGLLGPLIPHYRSLLLATCLRACKDPDPFIRASAISNLGQVCQHLHFSLGSVMHEVLLPTAIEYFLLFKLAYSE